MTPIGLALRAALDSLDDEGDNKEVTVIKTPKEIHMQPQQAQPKNVSKETFNYILAHPGCTPTQVADELQREGHLHKTVTALIYQMTRQCMLRKDVNKKLYVLLPAYIPIKTKLRTTKGIRSKKVNVQRVVDLVPGTDAGLASLAPRTQQGVPQRLTAKHVLDNVALTEAKALYEELHAIFGRGTQ